MRLAKITLWNFRSFWSDDTEGDQEEAPSAVIDLSAGVNYITGPNNVGKSNLLRAIALALDPNAPHDQELDRPKAKSWGPAIELELHADPNPSPAVKKLLDEVEDYERAIPGFQEPSLATQKIVRFYVEYHHGGFREERFLTRGSYEKGRVAGRNNKRLRAVERFHEIVRFVDIKSGEDLQSLLQRGFKEILASAVLAEHGKAMKHAEGAREAYVDALGQVLRPVAKHIQDRIRRYVRDVREVDLVPHVPPIEDALADARVHIEDAIRTSLDQKGTGVRGATLLLLLSFIADTAKTAVVFGIEEPEAFLHPDAHRELGAGLERFAQRGDVTVLVTTHSPFIFRSDGGAGQSEVFVVRKDENGRSTVAKDARVAARTELLGSEALSLLLEKAEEVPDRARLILVLEGETDARYLELAAQHLGIAMDDIHLVFWKRGASDNLRGAGGAALQAVTLAARHAPGRIVAALFDTDEDGKAGRDLLAKQFGWRKKKPEDGLFVIDYEQWVPGYNVPVEAEDVFATTTLDAFLADPVNAGFRVGSRLREKSGKWHYDLNPPGKIAFVKWLEQHGTTATFEPWRPILDHLRQLVADAGARKK